MGYAETIRLVAARRGRIGYDVRLIEAWSELARRRPESPDLVIMGKQAIDNDMNATGQMLAALMGWAQATFASELDVEGDSANVTREVDGGLQTIKVSLPAVVTADLRLNEPRYASLPNIMKAKKKPIEAKTAADLGVNPEARLESRAYSMPPERQAGKKYEDMEPAEAAKTVVQALRNEAKVI